MNEPREATLDVPYIGHPEQTHRVTYYLWGDEEAPPVLCVHGLTRNARDFDFLAGALSADFRVIALDMPGRGKSQWLNHAEEYSYPGYLQNLLFFLDALKLGPAHWIGTSMGGILGMMMATMQPERVRSLVLNDVGAEIPGTAVARIGAYAGKAMQFPTRVAGEQALREIYTPFGISREEIWRHFFTYDLQDQPDGSVRRNYDPAIGQSFTTDPTQSNVELWAFWQQVHCPVLLIHGEKSDILINSTIEQMRVTHPGMALHTVPGVGHAPTLMEEAEIMHIHRWLKAPAG